MIGSLVASWLAKQQVANILLLGRSGRPGADAGAVEQLVAGGGAAAAFHLVRCDAASGDEVAAIALAATHGRRLQVCATCEGGCRHSGWPVAELLCLFNPFLLLLAFCRE